MTQRSDVHPLMLLLIWRTQITCLSFTGHKGQCSSLVLGVSTETSCGCKAPMKKSHFKLPREMVWKRYFSFQLLVIASQCYKLKGSFDKKLTFCHHLHHPHIDVFLHILMTHVSLSKNVFSHILSVNDFKLKKEHTVSLREGTFS